jgi:hypothetical protein
LDGVCLVMAVAAMAVLSAIAKTYRTPQTETPITYWATSFATIMSLIASTRFDLANLLFPIYSISVDTLIAVMASNGRRRRSA